MKTPVRHHCGPRTIREATANPNRTLAGPKQAASQQAAPTAFATLAGLTPELGAPAVPGGILQVGDVLDPDLLQAAVGVQVELLTRELPWRAFIRRLPRSERRCDHEQGAARRDHGADAVDR